MRGPPGDRDLVDLLSFGVVNLDKPPGPSAHQVAGWIRDAVGARHVARAEGASVSRRDVTGCLPR